MVSYRVPSRPGISSDHTSHSTRLKQSIPLTSGAPCVLPSGSAAPCGQCPWVTGAHRILPKVLDPFAPHTHLGEASFWAVICPLGQDAQVCQAQAFCPEPHTSMPPAAGHSPSGPATRNMPSTSCSSPQPPRPAAPPPRPQL